jgi:hypothetical protein
MSEKKYVIPEGMLKAWENAYYDIEGKLHSGSFKSGYVRALEAALCWLDEELGKSDGIAPMLSGTYQDGWVGAWRHIRRLFRAPEPAVPEEIKDLLYSEAVRVGCKDPQEASRFITESDRRVLEAYRRGQKYGKE